MVCSIVSPAFAAGGQTGIISGTVNDANGNPVSGAAISAASPTGSYTATTAGNGTFTIVGVNVDTYVIPSARRATTRTCCAARRSPAIRR